MTERRGGGGGGSRGGGGGGGDNGVNDGGWGVTEARGRRSVPVHGRSLHRRADVGFVHHYLPVQRIVHLTLTASALTGNR